MTVFQLLIHSCLITNFSDGSLMSAECKWDNIGLLKFEQSCKTDGIRKIGSKIEDRTADQFKCLKLGVN